MVTSFRPFMFVILLIGVALRNLGICAAFPFAWPNSLLMLGNQCRVGPNLRMLPRLTANPACCNTQGRIFVTSCTRYPNYVSDPKSEPLIR